MARPSVAQQVHGDTVVTHISLKFNTAKKTQLMMLPHKEIFRPRVGLALSGGGIRGIAQIGAIQVLVDAGIPIDCIVGASIGGAVGALFASGYSPDDILEQVRQTEWNAILSDSPQRSSLFLGEKEKRGRALLQFRVDNFEPVFPEAISPGQQISNIFTKFILNAPYHASYFDQLKIPIKITATDLLSGEKVIFDQGDLAQAVRATVSIPLLFSPVAFMNLELVDGGVLDNIPVDETRKSGADIVIAIDTTSPLRSAENLEAPWEIADQITTIMQQEKDEEQLRHADIVISFNDMKIISTDFDAIDNLYSEGVKRTKLKLAAIEKAIHSRHEASLPANFIHIDKVTVEGANTEFLSRFINIEKNRFSQIEIHNALEKIYQTGDVKNVSADIVQSDLKSIIRFKIEFNPIVKSIKFIGNVKITGDSLDAYTAPLLQQPVNPYKTQDLIEQIVIAYRKRGLSLAAVDSIVFVAASGTAKFFISEGLIQSIDIRGLEKTKKFVIDREFNVRSGELFQFETAQSGLDNIIATDLFSSVNLTIDSRTAEHKLHLNLVEKPPFVLRFAANYDSERSARVFAEFADDNFLGTGNDLTYHIQYGGRDLKSYVDYRADRLFKSYITGGFNLHYLTSDHYAFSDLEETGEYSRRASGLNVALGQQIGRYGTLSGNLSFEEIDIDPISGYGYDTGSLSINTIGIKTVIDTRDRAPFATSGNHHIFFYQTSSGFFLGADITYFKVMNQLAAFNTFGKRHTFCPKIIWGASDLTTPYSEQFRIGGVNSFYGLREGQLWGRNMMLTSMAYRFNIPKFWAFETYISARYDLGATWNKIESIKSNDFLGGYGGAISIQTPIGPFSFAYGKTTKNQRQFYFTAGFDF